MADPTDTPAQATTPWWRDAAIYQVYIRSFADGDGDGIGDIADLRSRLPYLHDLGVDALWITPWYPSPMADAGYDVADYRDIDPLFGTLPEAEKLIDEAHQLGLGVLIDLVPNHSSDQHAWFQAALAARPGSPERTHYWFRPGRGPHGEQPPNNWSSRFGGPAWTRAAPDRPDDTDWYLHLFTPQQPDLNWDNLEVREEFEDVLRFWFDRGVDGFRIDVAHGLAKHPRPTRPRPPRRTRQDRPPRRPAPALGPRRGPRHLPHLATGRRRIPRRPGLRRRSLGHPPRPAHPLPRRRRPANRVQLRLPRMPLGQHPAAPRHRHHPRHPHRRQRTTDLGAVQPRRHPPRHPLRPRRTALHDAWRLYGTPTDLRLGIRRARAAALLTLALPGNAYIYQGEELGLWEIENLPADVLQDPARIHSGMLRDGCRVPLPWTGNQPPFGFTDGPATPWLPQPATWATHTAEAEHRDPTSMLTLYRRALRLRRQLNTTADPAIAWREAPLGALAFDRSPTWRCVVNTGDQDVLLTGQLLLASGPLDDSRVLPPDTAAWIAPAPDRPSRSTAAPEQAFAYLS